MRIGLVNIFTHSLLYLLFEYYSVCAERSFHIVRLVMHQLSCKIIYFYRTINTLRRESSLVDPTGGKPTLEVQNLEKQVKTLKEENQALQTRY